MTPLIRQLARRTLCAALALTPLWTSAAPLEPGAELPPLKLNDQYDKPVLIGPATRVLLFTTEKSTSDWVIKVLSAKASEHPGAVYVADISAMPSAIARMFAIPKLRELSFPVGLARDAAAVAELPRRAGSVSVLHLKLGRVTKLQFVQTDAQLLQALELAP
jgi:hypothetical protein